MIKKKSITIAVLVAVNFSCLFSSLFSITAINHNKEKSHEISEDEILYFPEGFLWGSATASYQIEGGNVNSNWYRFEESGKIKNNDSALKANDSYNLYKEDIKLLSELNQNSYRFSIEWSRIEPTKGDFDEVEINHYKAILQELNAKGIKTMVTLWHFSLPIWFEDEGGWENEKSAQYFNEYVEFVVSNLSEENDLWVTINEPFAYISSGYLLAKWPPAKKDYLKIPSVISNMIKAHKLAYETIHEKDSQAEVGFAQYTSYIKPKGKNNPIENSVSFILDKISNRYMVEELKDSLDFLGLHYYFKQEISTEVITSPILEEWNEVEQTVLGREYDPQGLYQVLMEFSEYDLPIYITEIGVQDSHPVERDKFIREHIAEMYYAINDGVDLRGIYYWSLLDNFEWSEGYEPKFGLASVDRETMERTIKEDAWEYALISGCNCVINE